MCTGKRIVELMIICIYCNVFGNILYSMINREFGFLILLIKIKKVKKIFWCYFCVCGMYVCGVCGIREREECFGYRVIVTGG